ncbi:import receptor subunit tom40 [Anaeramoeba flamelloides]|uniref:Import receptor subunit tom40 n=1 Tax=Anaeramoeba flamelloides TaxID=1746091 RepID=A0AAV7ZF97_9EUKA|nr:import receptor subunit tom40 [Anaeramoeba flamelloides]
MGAALSNQQMNEKPNKKIDELQNNEKKQEEEDSIPETNPGRFDNISRESTSILSTETMDGLEVKVNQQLNPFFSMVHTVRFGSVLKPPNYVLSSRFIRKQFALLGDIDQKGYLSARYFQQTTPKLLTTLYAELSPEPKSAAGMDLEYYGKDYTTRLRLLSNKLISLSYLQTLHHPNLYSGLEFTYAGLEKKTYLRSSTKYYKNNDILSLEITNQPYKHFGLYYTKKITNRIGIATDFIYNIDKGISHSSSGIRYDLRKSRFSTIVHSSGSISSSYEELYHPLASLKVSGEVNYQTSNYFFGLKLRFGPDI